MSHRNGQRNSEEIESDIHQARARLDDTLHELEEKLSPQQLMNMTYDYLRHGGAHDFASRLGNAIKENPLPVMVTGIGLGWLVLSQRNSHHGYDHEANPRQGGYPGSTMPQSRMPYDNDMPGSSRTISGAGTTTMGHDPAAMGATSQHGAEDHGHGEGMTHKAQQMAGSLKDRAQDMGSHVRDRAQELSGDMRDRAQHMGERMRSHQGGQSTMQSVTDRARDAGYQTSHFVQDHPLVAGTLGIAVGAVLGSLFSPTRMENEHLGDIRDRAVHRATEAGQEQVDRAQEKLHETAEQVKSEAREQGAQPSREENSAKASSYKESPSSEERYAKTGSSSGADASAARDPAAPKGGSATSASSTAGSASGSSPSGSSVSGSDAPGSSSAKPDGSNSTPSRGL